PFGAGIFLCRLLGLSPQATDPRPFGAIPSATPVGLVSPPMGVNVGPERVGRGSSPLGGGGLGKGGGQEGGGCNGVRNAPPLAAPLIQPPPPQGGGTRHPALSDVKLAPMGAPPHAPARDIVAQVLRG